MQFNFITIDGIDWISGRELQSELGITKDFSTWFKLQVERTFIQENKDFTTLRGKSTGGRPSIDYLVTVEAAKRICIVSHTKESKRIIDYLLELDKQHETGQAFTAPQIEALIDLSKSMTLISIQKTVEKQHFALHNNKYDWYEYRANLLGYSTKDIIDAMKLINKKHHETRASLMQLDANELIRVGVIDLFITLGKSVEYATNVGNLCKSMASKMKLGNVIWDDTKENPLKLKQGEIEDRKELFCKTQKMLK